MRASVGAPHEAGGRHVSGAERLVEREELEPATQALLRRARERAIPPEHIRISIDEIPSGQVHRGRCLNVTTVHEPNPVATCVRASEYLAQSGIAPAALRAAFALLQHGPRGDGTPMRGAAVLDARTGERLDPNPSRGVRASRFDYAPELRDAVREALTGAGLSHFRTYEALAVATKVIWAGVTAELCWSDDPEYVAGYLATAHAGYVRFPNFKPADGTGGRIFFTQDPTQTEQLIHRLQHECLLIASLPRVSSERLSEPLP